MNIKEIKQLIKLMVDNDLTELDVASGNDKFAFKRGASGSYAPPAETTQAPAPKRKAAKPAPKDEAPAEQLTEIRSPMVGTFYLAQSPDSEPYVSLGDAIADDQVVCIVEAMKVMNEIKAECSGTIAEICAENAQPVEFGQVLFRVRPS